MNTKVCPKCKIEKSTDDFYKRTISPDGLSHDCKKCRENYLLVKTYGITTEQRDDLFQKQGGKCAICGVKPEDGKKFFGLDHNHETLANRGVLCDNCNRGIGMLQDSPAILLAAIEYLKNPPAGPEHQPTYMEEN